MAENLWLSVVIPIYNGETTLSRAVESVICQMNNQVELILVDDGSTDNSGKICDEYAKKNSNIHVIHKENGGTSSAKNAGIKVAKGQYLSLMDCDDYIDADMYENIIQVLSEYTPDCLDFGWKYIGQGGEVTANHHKIEKNVLHTKVAIEENILPTLLNLCRNEDYFIYDFAWNKIYKTQIIKDNDVLFDEDKRTWEDRTFLLRYLKYCNSFYSMNRCFYYYTYMPNSLSQKYTDEYFRIIVQNFHHYRELYKDRFDFDTMYVNTYWANAIWSMILRSLSSTNNWERSSQKISEILKDAQVIHWYRKRKTQNHMERKASKLVIVGDVKSVLKLARKCKKLSEREDKKKRIIRGIKFRLKKMVKRRL